MSTASLTSIHPLEQGGGPHDSLLLRLLNPAPRVDLVSTWHPERGAVEDHVHACYQRSYEADVDQFLPWFLTLECLGKISGVAGMRPARSTPLFLEQYLDHPVESMLGEIVGTPVVRESVVEIGNLVASRRGSSHLLFLLFTSALYQAGYEWIAFTATKGLRNNLEKVGFPLHLLQPVDVAALDSATLDKWGSYYATEPLVMAGRLGAAMQLIEQRPLLRQVLRLYRPRIEELAAQLSDN